MSSFLGFLPEDIKKAKFVDLTQGWDDGDYLYTGLLQLTMMDGTKKEYKCDYIREGDRQDIKDQDMEAVVSFIIDREPEEVM